MSNPSEQPVSQYESRIRLRNGGASPLTIVLEPWGTRQLLAPEAHVLVVASGPAGQGELEVEYRADEIVVYGWSESRVAIVPET